MDVTFKRKLKFIKRDLHRYDFQSAIFLILNLSSVRTSTLLIVPSTFPKKHVIFLNTC